MVPEMSDQKRNITSLSMRAALTPSTANDEARTVDITWTTGAAVLRTSHWDDPFYEELSLDPKHVRLGRLGSGAPFLDGHDASRQIGVIERASLNGDIGIATVRFPKKGTDPEADKKFELIRQGIVKNVSVGYRVHKFQDVTPQGVTSPKTLRAVDWEPYEISSVSMGADDGAKTRAADELNECVFIVNRGAPQTESSKMNEQEIAAAKAKADEQRAAELKTATEAAAKAERERSQGIRTAVRAAKLEDSFADQLINDGTSLDKARAAVLDKLATASDAVRIDSHPSVTVTDDNRDKFVRGMSAYLFEKAGNGLIEQAIKRKAKGFEGVELDGSPYRGMRLSDVARLCAEREGHSTKGIYDTERLIKLALHSRNGYATPSDFSVLFENVMYKTMRAAYAVQSDTWRRFMGTDTVQDFRDSNRFLNGSFGTLPVVPEDAEYTNLSVPDGAKNVINTETRGAIIGLSRHAIVNDDMGALVDVSARFGATAGKSIEAAAYAMLALNSGLGPTMADSQPFFHTNRANVSTSAALTGAALDLDRVHMRKQLDISSNDYLDLDPKILLVPVNLETLARSINTDAFDHDSTKLQKRNMQQNMFNDIVSSPRLTASTTRRYLFTDAKEAFKVVFLAGSGEGPTIESQEGFRRDGVEWKVRIDFKVNPYDPKTAVTNAGT